MRYFPSTALVDKNRYPDIDEILEKATQNGFTILKTVKRGDGRPVRITSDFIELVRIKEYSMFHLIPEEEYEAGLKKLEEGLNKSIQGLTHSGETMVWLKNIK